MLLANWVGAASGLLRPLVDAIRKHVLVASKLHADDTPIPVQAPGHGKIKTAQLWNFTMIVDVEGWNLCRQGQEIFAAQIARLMHELKKWQRNGQPNGGDHPAGGQIFLRLRDTRVNPHVACFFAVENQRDLRYRTVISQNTRLTKLTPRMGL